METVVRCKHGRQTFLSCSACESNDRLKDAVKLLGTYTAGRFDVWLLAGPAKASCRAHVMSVLLGVKTPQSKSGVFALRAEFYARSDVSGLCQAAMDDNFRQWCKAQ